MKKQGKEGYPVILVDPVKGEVKCRVGDGDIPVVGITRVNFEPCVVIADDQGRWRAIPDRRITSAMITRGGDPHLKNRWEPSGKISPVEERRPVISDEKIEAALKKFWQRKERERREKR